MTTFVDAEQAADMVLRLGSPYDPEAVVEAARTVGELVRRLNHATFHVTGLAYPSQLASVVGNVNGAAHGLTQTLAQLADRLDTWANDPRLDDDLRQPPADVARQAAADLRAATALLSPVAGALEHAHALVNRLSYED